MIIYYLPLPTRASVDFIRTPVDIFSSYENCRHGQSGLAANDIWHTGCICHKKTWIDKYQMAMIALEGIDFETIRIALAMAMFGVATYFDLKKREVSDLLWMVFAAAAGVVYVFDFPSTLDQGVAVMVSMGFTAAVAYGIYRSGLFGGADMLALITLSAILPLYDGTFLGQNAAIFHNMAPLMVLTNGIIFSVAHVFFNVARNLVYHSKHPNALFEGLQHEPTSKKALAILVGHRSKNPQYDFPIERTVGGRREFDFALKPAETAEYETRKDVWVTSGIPFLVYFAAGFVMMVVAGDIFSLVFHGLMLPRTP